ncbi:hypothetical protein dqs_0594 [Azoarcus olearius]|uniref:hypothetical protein n=1 Tax=Azoarcus sp. (strain BH72) TaxID=418699 RepID=UPI0008061A20|nr:hypothetical protein [Azoarcus olearius]ANQ83670.1 hypothetical protein dqs_0594 [Azoarcus olearius]
MTTPQTLISVDITVRDSAGSYRTSKVLGVYAASTTSPARAAERLAEKLWGASDLDTAKRIDTPPYERGVSKWRITNAAALRAATP